MAVRRLAPEEIQPKSFAFSPENEVFAQEQIAKYPPGRQASAVIPLLWRAQEQVGGWLPRKAIEAVAARLDMPDIRVMEVATFYTMFNLDPVGKHFIQFCGTTPCALRGAGEIKKVLERRVGEQNHVSADGNFSWLEVECLGACCNAPMVQINHDYYEDLTPETFEALLDDLAAGRPVKPGPQSTRRTSEPHDDVKTLTDASLYDGSMIGAWRKRFDEEAIKAVDTGEAAAAKAAAASNPAPAKPHAGRAEGTEAADTPAKRVKEGEAPVSTEERRTSGDPSTKTVSEVADKGAVKRAAPKPQSDKSYEANPSTSDAGGAVAGSPTTPVAGTPPSKSGKRRDGTESKPDVVLDPTKKKS